MRKTDNCVIVEFEKPYERIIIIKTLESIDVLKDENGHLTGYTLQGNKVRIVGSQEES